MTGGTNAGTRIHEANKGTNKRTHTGTGTNGNNVYDGFSLIEEGFVRVRLARELLKQDLNTRD